MSGDAAGPCATALPCTGGRKFVASLTLLFAGLLFLRDPVRLLNPQFWAEDGSVFFHQAYDDGFWRALIEPTAGYLNFFPRLVAGLARPFPFLATPLIYDLAAFALQVAPIAYLLSGRIGRYLPNRRVRVVAALLYVAAPNTYETYVTLTNSQWNLALLALLLLLIEPPASRWGRVGESLVLGIFSLTGPLGVILLPAVAWSSYLDRATPRRRWSLAQVLILGCGAAVQLVFLTTTPRTTPGLDQGAPLALQEVVQILSTHAVLDSLLGIKGTIWASRHLGMAGYLAGLALAVFLAGYALHRRQRALLQLLWLAVATIALSFVFPLAPLRGWLRPDFGPRYYLYVTFFLIYAILLLCTQAGWRRWLGATLALPLLAVGIPGDFHYPHRPDTQWPAQVAAFESRQQGAAFYIPLQPQGYGGVSVRKRTPGQAASPLNGLRPAAGTPHYELSRPEIGGSVAWGNIDFLIFSGWAVDTPNRETAGGVWVVVDGMVFPAVFGRERPQVASLLGDQRYSVSGFIRHIPLSEIGLGRHRVSLVVLTHDRAGSYTVSGYDFVVRHAGEYFAVDIISPYAR